MKLIHLLFLSLISLSCVAQDRICISSNDTAAINKTLRLYDAFLDSMNFRPDQMLYVMKINEDATKKRSYTTSFILERSTLENYLIKYNYVYNFKNLPVIITGNYKVQGNVANLTFMEDTIIRNELTPYVFDDRNAIRFYEISPSLTYYATFPDSVKYYIDLSNIPEPMTPFLIRKMYPNDFLDFTGAPTNFVEVSIGNKYYIEVVEELNKEIIFKVVKSPSNPLATIEINFINEGEVIKLVMKNPVDKQLALRAFYENETGKVERRDIGPIAEGKIGVELWKNKVEKLSLENFRFME